MRIAIIVQRFGANLLGGSEFHAYIIGRMLARWFSVTVLTTCARDYGTWRNSYEPGESQVAGMRVLRFPVERERDIEAFNAFQEYFFALRFRTQAEELDWLERQGPYAPALVDHLRGEHGQYDMLLFFTYLYYPTVMGLAIAPEKSVLVPTFHLENVSAFSIFKQVMGQVRYLVYNTLEEKSQFIRLYGNRDAVSVAAGVPIDTLVEPHVNPMADPPVAGRYLLYCGRIDRGKGIFDVMDYVAAYRKQGLLGNEQLVITGKGHTSAQERGPLFLGFVSEADKYSLLANALVTLVPSYYESLSMLALESLYLGTPIIGRATCLPVKGHIQRGRCGLLFHDQDSFHQALVRLLADRGLRRRMGERGKRYVRDNYTMKQIVNKYNIILRHFNAGIPAPAQREQA